MSSYVVLARKWRPSQFSDIVGQTHIVRTMMNAIRSGRIHQAYLMTGSRGIGKTSIARIFAKAVRCENATTVEVNSQPWLRSCDDCSSCREITGGTSVDVLEIDGASNNGVDAIREIRENAKYLPASGSKKIYIIDEVHMLTTAAFNALLKTLEEPPPHVIFIFATTEPHKIPATILSRCQRFDLRRVTLAQIQSRLILVTSAENVQAESGALALLARAAEGSMRDAMSLLDQVIAFAGNTISTQAAREAIGLIEGQTAIGILRGVLDRKPLEALAQVDSAYQAGHDLKVLARTLIEFLYGTILAKVGASGSSSLELSEDEWKEIQTLAPLRELEELEMIFQVLSQGVEWIARSPQPKIVLDVLLIKCASAEALVSIDSGGGHPPGPGKGPSGGGGGREAPSSSRGAAPAPTGPGIARRVSPAGAVGVASPEISVTTIPPATPEHLATVSSIHATPKPAQPAARTRTWEGFIDQVRRSRPLIASFLEHGTCDRLPTPGEGEDCDLLAVYFRPEDGSFRDNLQKRVNSDLLLTLAKEYFQRHCRIQIELREAAAGNVESMAIRRERERREREASAMSAAKNHPIITEAIALFGGELGPIELIEPQEGAPRDAAL